MMEYQCNFCEKVFHHSGSRNRHIRIVHQKIKSQKCEYCEKKFCQNSDLIRHITAAHSQENIQRSYIRVGKSFECDYCKKRFSWKKCLQTHVVVQHLKQIDLPEYQCFHCDRKCSTKNGIQKHLETIHTQKKKECNECHRIFNRRDTLIRHIQMLHDATKTSHIYECSECQQIFKRKEGLLAHTRATHKTKTSSSTRQLSICECCSFEFKERRDLKAHLNSRYKISNPKISKRGIYKQFRCAVCRTSSFSWKAEIVAHLEKEHDVHLDHHRFEYPSEDEFYAWKHDEEEILMVQFIKRRVSKFKHYTKISFSCSRSGNYNSKSKGKRRMRLIGTKKINGYCPAEIVLIQELGSSVCRGTYTSTHLGHDVSNERELVYMNLKKHERDEIAAAIRAGVPFIRIQEEICSRYDAEGKDTMKKLFLTNTQDLRNIASAYRLKSKPEVEKKLKYWFANRRKLKKVPDESDTDFKYSVQLQRDQKVRQLRGNLAAELTRIRRRHNNMELDNNFNIYIEDKSKDSWMVSIFGSEKGCRIETYSIDRIAPTCENCSLMCDKCLVCAHAFQCSCVDCVENNNMCKHIHCLVKYRPHLSALVEATSVEPVNLIEEADIDYLKLENEPIIEIIDFDSELKKVVDKFDSLFKQIKNMDHIIEANKCAEMLETKILALESINSTEVCEKSEVIT